jgi:hypothetical protein
MVLVPNAFGIAETKGQIKILDFNVQFCAIAIPQSVTKNAQSFTKKYLYPEYFATKSPNRKSSIVYPKIPNQNSAKRPKSCFTYENQSFEKNQIISHRILNGF